MSYTSGNRPNGGSDPWAAKGQRSPYLQDDATDVYDNAGIPGGRRAAPPRGRAGSRPGTAPDPVPAVPCPGAGPGPPRPGAG